MEQNNITKRKFYMQNSKMYIKDMDESSDAILLKNIRIGVWKVKRKEKEFIIYHKNIETKLKQLKPYRKQVELINKHFILGLYNQLFYDKTKNNLNNSFNYSYIYNYFYNTNYYEFCYIKNKPIWLVLHYYKLSKTDKNFNCLQGGAILSIPNNSKITITTYYQHGEIVAIKLKYI